MSGQGANDMDEPGGSPPCFDTSEQPLELWADGYGFGEAPDTVRVFGVVIEVATKGGTATFTAYRTGDASMHTSGGAVRSDWVSPETVRRTAIALVECAEPLLGAFAPVAEAAAPPSPGYARFHLITDRGRFFHDETIDALNNDSGKLPALTQAANALFSATGDLPTLTQAANALFTELRVLDETRQRGGQ